MGGDYPLFSALALALALALIKRMRDSGSDVPIVLFTDDVSDGTRDTALGLGATRVVTPAKGVKAVVGAVIELAGARDPTS